MTSYEDVDPLGLYFGRFLHEDWMYEFESPQSAFEELLKLPSATGVRRLMEQIAGLLQRSDQELKAELYRYSPYLDVSHDYGWNEREWLQSLRDRAAAELAARSGSEG